MPVQIRCEVTWKGNAVAELVKQGALDGLEEFMMADVKPVALAKCPVRSGVMRASHVVERSDQGILLGAGGSAAPYAERQHEDASLHHRVGEDHWITKALQANYSKAATKVADHINSKIGGK